MSADSEKPNLIGGNWMKYCTVAKFMSQSRPIWTSVVVCARVACALRPVCHIVESRCAERCANDRAKLTIGDAVSCPPQDCSWLGNSKHGRQNPRSWPSETQLAVRHKIAPDWGTASTAGRTRHHTRWSRPTTGRHAAFPAETVTFVEDHTESAPETWSRALAGNAFRVNSSSLLAEGFGDRLSTRQRHLSRCCQIDVQRRRSLAEWSDAVLR